MNKLYTWILTSTGCAVATFLIGRNSEAHENSDFVASTNGEAGAAAPDAVPAPTWCTPIGTETDASSGLPKFVRDQDTGIEMVLIPAGSFRRGDVHGRGRADERPVHDVRISQPFYLGRHEVTQAQWRDSLTQSTVDPSPSRHRGDDRQPVENISWNDVQIFLKVTGLRLPTEAEWEYAARAGDSADAPTKAVGWFRQNASAPKPVGLQQNAANAWGVAGMFGNVSEWCADAYDPKFYHVCAQQNPIDDPRGPSGGPARVVRGTNFRDHESESRYGHRRQRHENHTFGTVGLRVARNP